MLAGNNSKLASDVLKIDLINAFHSLFETNKDVWH